jgi:hypothetical protein
MSIKPKHSRTDSDAAAMCETTFFIWDEKDNHVAIEATQHPEEVAWPRQVLRVIGPSPVPAPQSPMSAAEYAAWQQALDSAGFDLDVRFK